jgi:hypothetical protein
MMKVRDAEEALVGETEDLVSFFQETEREIRGLLRRGKVEKGPA